MRTRRFAALGVEGRKGEGRARSSRPPLAGEAELPTLESVDLADGGRPGRATQSDWTVVRGAGRAPDAARGRASAPIGVGVGRSSGDRPTMTVRRDGRGGSGSSEAEPSVEASADRPLGSGVEHWADGPVDRASFAGADPTRGVDVDRFVDRFYRQFERKIRVERERRGL